MPTTKNSRSRRNRQKVYKMKGCSLKRKNVSKKHLGGNNVYLAHPSNNIQAVPNPFLAYNVKKGGRVADVYPSTGANTVPKTSIFLNPLSKRGGSCGSCGSNSGIPLMSGGSCPLCNSSFMKGGNNYNNTKIVKGGRKGRSTRRLYKGGALDNLLYQDLINLGRQFNYGVGSAYNAISGYPAPVNPLPWKGQLPNNPNLQNIKPVSL
jgi:hypothetical protein